MAVAVAVVAGEMTHGVAPGSRDEDQETHVSENEKEQVYPPTHPRPALDKKKRST